MNLKEEIKLNFPKFPDEVIEFCLFPIAETEGGLPSKENAWDTRVFGEKLNFWHDSEWKKTEVNLNSIPFSKMYVDTMKGMQDAYIDGIENSYWKHLGENGKRRFQKCLTYILKNSKFPVAPILITDEIGRHQVMDGNHRFLGLIVAERFYKEYQTLSLENRQKFLDGFKITSLKAPDSIQEVWICKPNWENNQNAQTRNLLRLSGYGDF